MGFIPQNAEKTEPWETKSRKGFAPGFVAEGFRSHGIRYMPSERDRSALYLELLPLINAGRVGLLDDTELLRELRGLERRRGSSGRDRVDHMPGFHDDRANSCAGAIVEADQNRVRYYVDAAGQRHVDYGFTISLLLAVGSICHIAHAALTAI